METKGPTYMWNEKDKEERDLSTPAITTNSSAAASTVATTSRGENDFDLVICSDCFYDAASFPGLFRTIERIVEKTNGRAKFLFGFKLRHAAREAAFMTRLEQELGATLCMFGQAAVCPRALRGLGIHLVLVCFPPAR